MTWPIVTLDEVADTALGKMLDRGRPQGLPLVPYLRNVNVQWGRIDTDDLLTMELADAERERFAVLPGDLLVCEGGEIGRCALWTHRAGYLAYQKALHRIRPSARVDSKFLRYHLEHQANSGVLARFATGSTIAHLPQQQLRRLPVPLPPVEEQRRIIDTLEDHLSRLDGAHGYACSASRRLDHVREATLREMLACSDSERSLGDILAVPLTNGRSVPTREDGFPVLRLTALQETGVDLRERKGGDWTSVEARRFLVAKGDYLIARGNGSLRLVGRGSLVRQKPDAVAFPDTAIRARPENSIMSPEFLDVVWNSTRTRVQIESMARCVSP